MNIRDIVDRYCSNRKFMIDDDIVKSECVEFVKSHMDKCDLDKDIQGYVAILISAYYTRYRSKKIDLILE